MRDERQRNEPAGRWVARAFLGGPDRLRDYAGIASPMLNFAFVFGEEVVSKAKTAGAAAIHEQSDLVLGHDLGLRRYLDLLPT